MKRELVAAVILMMVGSSANALPVKLKGTGAEAPAVNTPEIQNAGQRVSQAKAQMEVANKQLNAAKALLRAASADLRAAEAELRALTLQAQAQGLVNETGMTPAKAPPVQLAVKDEQAEAKADTTPAVATPPAAAPTPGARLNSDDLNGGSTETNSSPAIELR